MANDQLVRTEFLTGAAGTGKTFTIKRRIEEDPGCAIICATTGVAAVNMDTVTINSVLGYYDTESLVDKYILGYVHQRLRKLAQEFPNKPRDLVIDEVSMMHAEQLDTIYKAIYEVNMGDDQHDPLKYPLGLTLTGDFCQLPPVKGRWAFLADCWPEFAAATTRLTKVWRQQDPGFLDAINLARSGNGELSAICLKKLGANFSLAVDLNFDGTTIVAKNAEADRFNQQRLLWLTTPSFALETKRWGQQSGEWRNIPDRLILKPGCLVMLLANKQIDGSFQYVNGDHAHVIEYSDDATFYNWAGDSYEAPGVRVKSVRTKEEFWVERIVRYNTTRDKPDEGVPFEENLETGKYIIGWVDWFPMRLGYASTVHKTQGLSLDRVQIDCRDGFFGAPSMAYVALSRARSIDGMRVVGSADLLARRIKFNQDVREWL